VEASAACQVPEPCLDSSVQLVEIDGHAYGTRPLCVFEALAERRIGRYRHDTNATFSNGNAGAWHTLVVRSDGTVSYIREPYRNVFPPPALGDLPPIEPLRCTLKPASYFEACHAAVEEAAEGGAGGPSQDDEVAWSCAFGDGSHLTPSALLWFESCVSEDPLQCE
jgi:hypothetical protein